MPTRPTGELASASVEQPLPGPKMRDPPPAPVALSAAEEQALSRALNELALDLFRVTRTPRNDVFSPASVASGLGLLLPGARGETEQELRRALRFDGAPARLLEFQRAVFNAEERGCQVSSANAALVQSGYPLVPEYEHLLQTSTTHLVRTPIGEDPQAARAQANDWIEQRTGGRIRELLPPGSVGVNSRLILANALSFEGKWLQMFSRSSTDRGSFRLLDGTSTLVRMMRETLPASFAAFDEVRVLELPYACGHLVMMLLLPETGETEPWMPTFGTQGELSRRDGGQLPTISRGGSLGGGGSDSGGTGGLFVRGPVAGVRAISKPPVHSGGRETGPKGRSPASALDALERALTTERLETWVAALEQTFVRVALPPFEVRGRKTLDGALRELGVRTAFTERADFRGISGEEPLSVGGPYHAASLAVDEAGTSASAGTAVVLHGRGGPPRVARFEADRPFLFLVRDRRSGLILFIGRVVDPRG